MAGPGERQADIKTEAQLPPQSRRGHHNCRWHCAGRCSSTGRRCLHASSCCSRRSGEVKPCSHVRLGFFVNQALPVPYLRTPFPGTTAGGGAGLSTLADTVSAASRSYCSALARLYPASSAPLAVSASMAAAQLQRVSLGRVPAGLQMQQEAVAVLRREAQVKFSALVAAQTWLTQVRHYLRKLAMSFKPLVSFSALVL